MPLAEELVVEIEEGKIRAADDLKVTARTLIDKYEWDQHDAKKLWVFGPDQSGPNFLIDQTKAVQYLNEIRDSMEGAFQNVTKEGVLAEENLRGVRFGIQDVELHNDAIHRGGGQIIPTARRVYYACEMTATPRYQEPIYLCNIATPSDVMSGVYQCFAQRRGVVFNEETVQGTPLLEVKAYLPVSESFGFTAHLRSLTSGQAFPQCAFDHWDLIQNDPFDVKSKSYEEPSNPLVVRPMPSPAYPCRNGDVAILARVCTALFAWCVPLCAGCALHPSDEVILSDDRRPD